MAISTTDKIGAVPEPEWAYLVVNADDYGYYHCVSRGILESARRGIVTATGVFANSPHLAEHAAWLRDHPQLDVGVHLNLTDREPLTVGMRNKLGAWAGEFPAKFALAKAILASAIKTEDVQAEWRAQIERCLEHRLALTFLNSHEHIHMLPGLFKVSQVLAEEYGIPHLRCSAPESPRGAGMAGLLRDGLLGALALLNRRQLQFPVPRFLGMGNSGKLSLDYLRRRLPTLRSGEVYELMCHPGQLDESEISDPRLRHYHDWEGELATLTHPALPELLHQHRVRLIGYRHLNIASGQFDVRVRADGH
jgi:hypothetical protein